MVGAAGLRTAAARMHRRMRRSCPSLERNQADSHARRADRLVAAAGAATDGGGGGDTFDPDPVDSAASPRLSDLMDALRNSRTKTEGGPQDYHFRSPGHHCGLSGMA